MRSIGARIALWYAGAATATLAVLFVAGYALLERNLLHGLDLLNRAEFQQIASRLGPEYETLSAPFIEMRIRETTESASTLFYILIRLPKQNAIFRSTNLNGHDIPDVAGAEQFSVRIPEVGDVRAAEFYMKPFIVMVATPLAQVNEVMASYVKVCAALVVAMLAVSLLIGAGLSRLILAPVRLIRDAALRISSDNLGERIAVADVRDEVSDVARLLNQMFDRLEATFLQIRRFTAEASHELKTPLSLIRLQAERMIGDESLPVRHREALQDQLEEIERLTRIIEDLLLLSRADAHVMQLELVPRDPAAFLHGFAQDAQALAEHQGLRFEWSHEGHGAVPFDERWMRQVLLNLLVNAIRVSPPGAPIRLNSRLDQGVWQLSLQDQGPGLTPEQCERVFERFVRFVDSGADEKEDRGTGLGLAISRSIVGLHGGTISAHPAGPPGSGLQVLVELPAVRA
ncbi:ATP-binding protein [Variovorax sp. LjRoot290]|uniref:sensor histidine kinase n=1 Tax=Variovorax sp. LjRoot290 TaxID=3342316 RepID=UPI003ECE861C